MISCSFDIIFQTPLARARGRTDQASIAHIRAALDSHQTKCHLQPMLMRNRGTVGFIEPCLPSPAKAPPSGPGWLHEIKHDGFRIMARRNGAGVRLISRNGHDFTARFPLAVEAVSALSARSFLLDGEAIVHQ